MLPAGGQKVKQCSCEMTIKTRLLCKSLRAIINPRDEEPLLRLLDPCDTSPPQMLHKLRQGHPASRIHVQMVSVLYQLLVDVVRLDAVGAVSAREELDEVELELRREVCDMFAGVLADHEHLTKMRFRLSVTLESILISTLLLAHLTVPPQPLKSLGLHLIGEVLGGSDFRAKLALYPNKLLPIRLPSARGILGNE